MENSRPKEIIEGFYEDVKFIVEDFKTSFPNLRLSDFFNYWTDKSLDCLFANRYDPRELLEAISEINKLLIQIITDLRNQDDDQTLVALYFLLCLYAKQPNRLRRKIRLTCTDVIFLKNFVTKQKSFRQNSDAIFVLEHLIAMQAIDFVEERLIYGPSMLVNRGIRKPNSGSQPGSNDDDDHLDTTEFLESKIEPTLSELGRVNGPYQHIKDTLKLDEYTDSTVEVKSFGTMPELLEQAKTLFEQFKAEYNP